MNKTLDQIFNQHGCDRGSIKHGYHRIYEKELSQFKTKSNVNLLEIGIYKGAGLSSWLDYFPNANQIVGIDLFDRVQPADVSCLSNKRVNWFKGDSRTIQLPDSYLKSFDVIIDDGLHTPDSNRQTFTNLIRYLKPTGLYFIEDIWPIDRMTTSQMNHHWIRRHSNDYTLHHYNEFLSSLNSYSVEQFDLRSVSGHPDSYLFKITRCF